LSFEFLYFELFDFLGFEYFALSIFVSGEFATSFNYSYLNFIVGVSNEFNDN
jgi:hypothetical protein